MPNILALDTSSDNCSVALYQNAELDLMCEPAPRKHTQLILPMVKSIVDKHHLALNQFDALAFGCGPGSFTGIRIAAGVAQGFAFGLDCPVYPISNLKAMALQCYREHGISKVLVAIDARMDEVYWSLCLVIESSDKTSLEVKTLLGEFVTKPELLELSDVDLSDGLIGCGSGFEFFSRFPDSTQNALCSFDQNARPKADAICELALVEYQQGKNGDISSALPSYVRDTVTWKKLPGRE